MSIAILVFVTLLLAGYLAYQNHLIPQNIFSFSSYTKPALANSPQTTILADDLDQKYLQNKAQADSQYTGKLAYLAGSVGEVDGNGSGSYVSCQLSSGYPIGCTDEQYTAFETYINWNWENSSVAASVPLNTSFIAECQVQGLDDLNLILKNCVIIAN